MLDIEALPLQERTTTSTVDKIMDVIADDTISDRVRELRTEALSTALRILNGYIEEGYDEKLIDAIRHKRFGFIMQATTIAEVKQINSFVPPRDNFGTIVIDSPYHIEEEELIIWNEAAARAPLNPLAMERIALIFKRIYGFSLDDF